MHAQQHDFHNNDKSICVPALICVFFHTNGDFRTSLTSLYGSLTAYVVLSTHNSVLSTRIKDYVGSSPHVWFCAYKSATLAHELLVSIGPSLHVWLLVSKQRLLDWNYKDLWVKDHTRCFCMQNFDFWTRITSLYGSLTWPVILCMYNSVLNNRITSLYGSQPSSVVFAFKTAWLASELLVSMGPRPHDWFLDAKQRLSDRNKKSLWVLNITFCFVHAKRRD